MNLEFHCFTKNFLTFAADKVFSTYFAIITDFQYAK